MTFLAYWREGIIAALTIALGITYLCLKAEQRHTAKVSARLTETTAAYERFQADVKARTAEAKANDLANAARVKLAETQVREEVSDAYENLLSRYNDTLKRLRASEAKAHSGRSDGTNMPRSANAPGSPDSPGGSAIVSFEDLNICAVNTAKAETWLKWWDSVKAIPR